MRKLSLLAVVVLILGATIAPAVAVQPSAREHCLEQGGTCTASEQPPVAPPSRGGLTLFWDNGPANLLNGLSSERNTAISGTGGPEGDHASTVADDFQVPAASGLQFEICLFATAEITAAEMYVWSDAGGTPALPVTSPVLGGPTTASIVSTTYSSNTPDCGTAFGFEGRLYVFNEATTGVPLSLPEGTYWVGAVGEDAGGGRAFFADSSPVVPLADGKWGSTLFGFPYWSETSAQGQPAFSFRVFGSEQTQSILEIPTLGGRSLLLLVALLGAAALVALRLRR